LYLHDARAMERTPQRDYRVTILAGERMRRQGSGDRLRERNSGRDVASFDTTNIMMGCTG
jgi:hypothetical protein